MLPCKILNKLSLGALVDCKYHMSVSRSRKVTKEVAEAIKKLNKENKNLFGRLLETRSQKRQKENRNVDSIVKLAGNSESKGDVAELQWALARSPKSVTKLGRSNSSQMKIVVRKSSNHIGKTGTNIVETRNKIGLVSETDTKSTVDVEDLIPKFNDTNLPPLPGSSENTKKHCLLHLPDNVLKSIPSFPLFNRERKTECASGNSNGTDSTWKPEYYTYPGVSRILNATMSEKSRVALRRWQQKMIAELGQEGFMEFYTGQLSQGEEFHVAVCSYLSGVPESNLLLKSEAAEGCWHSVRHSVMTDITSTSLLEEPLVHPQLRYQGVADCVALYKGKPLLIEWKKSDKRKSSINLTFDAPLQVCAYMGALHFDPRHAHLQVGGGLVVVAYSNGSPADLFVISVDDCQKYWQQWLTRLQQYWLRNTEVVENAATATAAD